MLWIRPLPCLLFMVAAIAPIVPLVRRGVGGSMMRGFRAGAHRPTPRQLLERRLAGGEITKEPYDATQRDIDSPAAHRSAA